MLIYIIYKYFYYEQKLYRSFDSTATSVLILLFLQNLWVKLKEFLYVIFPFNILLFL